MTVQHITQEDVKKDVIEEQLKQFSEKLNVWLDDTHFEVGICV